MGKGDLTNQLFISLFGDLFLIVFVSSSLDYFKEISIANAGNLWKYQMQMVETFGLLSTADPSRIDGSTFCPRQLLRFLFTIYRNGNITKIRKEKSWFQI